MTLPDCPKEPRPFRPMFGFFVKPPPAIDIIRQHFANHRKRLPKTPFKPLRATRNVFDFGKAGWYADSAVPHNRSIPYSGSIEFMLDQHLGYEHSIRRAVDALVEVGRITKQTAADFIQWLDNERVRYDERDDLPNALRTVQKLGLKVATPRTKASQKLLANAAQRAKELAVKEARRAAARAARA